MHDVFVSFSFADQNVAEEIVNVLTSKYGISCWICTRDIDGGKRYKRLIPQAIDDAQVVIFLQSENALGSKEIPKEIGIAFDADKTIIPFRLDQAQLHGDLRYDLYGVEYIDATIPTWEQRIDELARAIQRVVGKTVTAETAIPSKQPMLRSGKIICHEIFAGRDDLLREINDAFRDRDVIFLHGMGGIGKSELACQYWKANRDFYTTVIFARYENSLASLIADDRIFEVKGIGRKTKEDNTQQTDEEYSQEKLNAIKSNADAHTLLIIDNYDVVSDPFFDELVKDAPYRVLVTTRCEQERGRWFVLPVREIADDTLKKIFIEYANPQKTLIDEEDAAFPELFDLTNRHTLTLELIAKYMDEKDIDEVGEIVDALKKQSLSVLSDSDKRDGFETIKNIFRMTSLSDKEKAFMRCLAMMPPAGINQKYFKKWCADTFSARSRLVDLSLVKINSENKTIGLHPIIREVVIDELKPSYENCSAFIDRCAMVGEDYDPIMWQLPFHEKHTLLQCYKWLLKYVGDITDENYEVFQNIAFMYHIVGDYGEAIELAQRIYRFALEHYGEDDPRTVCSLIRLGWKNNLSFNNEEAIKYYKQVFDWYLGSPERKLRAAHTSLITYGELLVDRYERTHCEADIQMATKCFDTFMEIRQKYLDQSSVDNPSDPEYVDLSVAGINRAFFKLYFKIGEYNKAEYYLRQFEDALNEYNRDRGMETNPDTASLYRSYGELKYARGEYRAAIDDLLEANRLYKIYFSDRFPRIVHALARLSQCYCKENMYREAKDAITEAIEIAKTLYTQNHPLLQELAAYKQHIESEH